MRDFIPRIRQAGAELVILGNGTPEHARWFTEEFGWETPVFTDPALRSHQVVGARRGPRAVFDPRTFLAAARARRQGFAQAGTKGSAVQVGGLFVITPAGDMPYRYLSRFAGDHPGPEAAVSALEACATRAT